ncbi:hypothetical protein ES703_80007 [subsurface metagenome]
MKAILEILLRIIRHPGVLRLIVRIFKTIDEMLQDDDDNNKS